MSSSSLDRALLYRDAIDRYATLHGLNSEALSAEDWGMVEIVASWLKLFCDTTTRDKTTISSVYAVFLGLQDNVRQHIKSASAGMSARLKAGLIGAHEKLAEYFKKLDPSPFYMWAACECCITCFVPSADSEWLVLDPRVTFHGTLCTARGADDLREDVFKSKLDFERYCLARYSDEPSTTSTAEPTGQDAAYQIFDLFAENADEPSAPQQELEWFFALRPEKYGTSPDPAKWWASRQLTFPRLARMARDILSIPGQFHPICFRDLQLTSLRLCCVCRAHFQRWSRHDIHPTSKSKAPNHPRSHDCEKFASFGSCAACPRVSFEVDQPLCNVYCTWLKVVPCMPGRRRETRHPAAHGHGRVP
jgi:hypothetical protein